MFETLSEILPLEKRRLQCSQNGVGQILPALHKNWIEQRDWMSYQVPPVGKDTLVVGAMEAWMERSNFVLDDLEFLLGLNYHKFWSQVAFDEGLKLSIGRLLRLLPRPHDRFWPHPDSNVRCLLSDILRKIFLILLRLSTHKESATDFMSSDAFGKIIYDNFIFDIPKLLDLSVLFYSANSSLVEKMVTNIMTCQPAYESDLKKALSCTSVTITKSLEQMETFVQNVNYCGREEENNRESSAYETLIDLVVYVADLTVTLSSFLKAFPKAAILFHQLGLGQQLGIFYQNGLIPTQVFTRGQLSSGCLSETIADFVTSEILLARHSILLIFRSVISNVCVTPAIEGGHKDNLVEEFLQSLSTAISEPKFYQDYCKMFPIEDDVDIFQQAGLEVETLRLQYLIDGASGASRSSASSKGTPSPTMPNTNSVKAKENEIKLTAAQIVAGTTKSRVEKDSLISQVRDLLPHLGEGFVELCLDYFDSQPDKVINAILEENLPPNLAEMDRAAARKSPTPMVGATALPEILSNRNNIYDGDEFDVNTRSSIDKSRIHKRKKMKSAKNANALLDDKRDLSGLKDKFSALSIVADYDYDIDYDDEYDDTYDDHAMGEKEPDAMDEILERRPFVQPRVLARGGGDDKNLSEDEGDDDDDQADDQHQKHRFDFARNPEEIRAEAERKRQAKMSSRGGGRHRGGGGEGPPNRDVVGKPKGQGQDKSVVINRARKNENKGKHHRVMADKKMSKGMF